MSTLIGRWLLVLVAVSITGRVAQAQQRCAEILGDNAYDCRVSDNLSVFVNTPVCMQFTDDGNTLDAGPFGSELNCSGAGR